MITMHCNPLSYKEIEGIIINETKREITNKNRYKICHYNAELWGCQM